MRAEQDIIKLLCIGDAQVGKSNLILRYLKNEFNPQISPTTGTYSFCFFSIFKCFVVGFEFATKTVQMGTRTIQAQLWDTYKIVGGGSITATAAFYRNAVGVFLMYDISRRESFDRIKAIYMKQIQQYAHENALLILIGNKSDLAEHRKVSRMEGIRFAEQHGMDFIETSALDGTNVTRAFTKIILPIARLVTVQPNVSVPSNIPPGWKKVTSRTRAGDFSYENQYTKERVAFVPLEAAKPIQYHFQLGQGLGITVTKEQVQTHRLKLASQAEISLFQTNACACSVCVIL